MSSMYSVIAGTFFDLTLILVAARAGGWAASKLNQPRVVGEIAVGLLLGPSLLGALPGSFDRIIFPIEVRPVLSDIAQIGLVVFMFIIGLHTDLAAVRRARRAVIYTATGSLLLPFGSGVGAALLLFPSHSQVNGVNINRAAFVMLMGVSISITAFPVLARILEDGKLNGTRIGVITLFSASINDFCAWILLAGIVAMTSTGNSDGPLWLVPKVIAILVALHFIVKPVIRRFCSEARSPWLREPMVLATIAVGLLASAWATSVIGLHAVIGAFVFGVLAPSDELFRTTSRALQTVTSISRLLLPVFFVTAGFAVDISFGWGNFAVLLLLLAVACGSKIVGAGLGAQAAGLKRREAFAIGVLMNTRGLTEIIVLTLGRDLGLLDDTLYSVLMFVTIITTAMAGPLVRRILKLHDQPSRA